MLTGFLPIKFSWPLGIFFSTWQEGLTHQSIFFWPKKCDKSPALENKSFPEFQVKQTHIIPKWLAKQYHWYPSSHNEWFLRPWWWALSSSEVSDDDLFRNPPCHSPRELQKPHPLRCTAQLWRGNSFTSTSAYQQEQNPTKLKVLSGGGRLLFFYLSDPCSQL